MTAKPTVELEELLTAVEWVSSEGAYDHFACVSRATGVVHFRSSSGEMDEELPADIDDDELYVEVPSRRDLDLGRNLVLRFAEAHLPDAYDEVDSIFGRPGAYSRYKALLERRGLLEPWYRYEAEATERAVRDWCEENGLTLTS